MKKNGYLLLVLLTLCMTVSACAYGQSGEEAKKTETTPDRYAVPEKEPATEYVQPFASDNTKQEVSENNSDERRTRRFKRNHIM